MQIVIDYAAHKTKIQKHTSNTPFCIVYPFINSNSCNLWPTTFAWCALVWFILWNLLKQTY